MSKLKLAILLLVFLIICCIQNKEPHHINEPVGGVTRHDSLWLKPGEERNLSYVLYTGDYEGEVVFSVYKGSRGSMQPLPEEIEIKITPSTLYVRPNEKYVVNIGVTSKHNLKDEAGYLYTFLIRAKLGDKVMDDWFMVIVSNEARSIAFPPPEEFFEKNVSVKVGETKVVNYSIYTSAIMGKLKLQAFLTSEVSNKTKLPMPDGMRIEVKPSEVFAAKWRKYTFNLIIKTTPDLPPGKYVICVYREFGELKGYNWIIVDVIPS